MLYQTVRSTTAVESDPASTFENVQAVTALKPRLVCLDVFLINFMVWDISTDVITSYPVVTDGKSYQGGTEVFVD